VARKSSSTAIQEELYPLPGDSQHRAPERELFDDARLVDLEAEQESPFLRGQKRVSVRRGSLPKKTANRLMWVALALVAFAILGAAGLSLYRYGERSWRFRVDSSDQIEVTGAEHVAHAHIMEVMGEDIGRNIFFVPLAQRKLQLEQIPWVESASVMRLSAISTPWTRRPARPSPCLVCRGRASQPRNSSSKVRFRLLVGGGVLARKDGMRQAMGGVVGLLH